MDLSDEKIIFKARTRKSLWFIAFLFIAGGLAVWGMVIMDIFFNPQASYHSQQDFLESCGFLAGIAFFFMTSRLVFGQQFYMTETGIIRRRGISGKLSRVSFDKIVAAALYTVNTKNGQRRQLKIICQNHQSLTMTSTYTDESIGSAAAVLEKHNIPIYPTIKEATGIAATTAGYVMEKSAPAEQSNDPLHVYLHYAIAWLPLFVAGCLFVGGVLNSQWGTQTDIVVYGTVISKRITHGSGSPTGKIILRSGQTKEQFPVSPQLVAHLRTGDRVKVRYTRGCFGLDYDLDCTKLGKGN